MIKNTKKKRLFIPALLIFQLLLILLAIFAIVYVNSLLKTYERSQPERLVEAAIDALQTKAEQGTLWNENTVPNGGKLEQGIDIQEKYSKLFADGNVKYSVKAGLHELMSSFIMLKPKTDFYSLTLSLKLLASLSPDLLYSPGRNGK